MRISEEPDNPVHVASLLALTTREQLESELALDLCNCSTCTLARQQDFVSQKNALEELYDTFNAENSTNYKCYFLPKFHPELNPIERCWSRMKFYTKKNTDGTLETLEKNMMIGLEQENLPVTLIRKYFRICDLYLSAYKHGLNVIQAEDWLRKRKSHRGYHEIMDKVLWQAHNPHISADDPEIVEGHQVEEVEEDSSNDDLNDIINDIEDESTELEENDVEYAGEENMDKEQEDVEGEDEEVDIIETFKLLSTC